MPSGIDYVFMFSMKFAFANMYSEFQQNFPNQVIPLTGFVITVRYLTELYVKSIRSNETSLFSFELKSIENFTDDSECVFSAESVHDDSLGIHYQLIQHV